MLKLLDKTQIIRKKYCEVQISEIQDGHNIVCHVISTGKSSCYKWKQNFESVYRDCAILVAKNLINLPGKRFLVHQINEHSRGGHYECEICLLNLRGKVLNKFEGRYNSKVLLDDKYIWFYISRKEANYYASNSDLIMIKLNYITGKAKTVSKRELPPYINTCFWNYMNCKALN